jgi:hypothetical protein
MCQSVNRKSSNVVKSEIQYFKDQNATLQTDDSYMNLTAALIIQLPLICKKNIDPRILLQSA